MEREQMVFVGTSDLSGHFRGKGRRRYAEVD
jgi:hypothetical protein